MPPSCLAYEARIYDNAPNVCVEHARRSYRRGERSRERGVLLAGLWGLTWDRLNVHWGSFPGGPAALFSGAWPELSDTSGQHYMGVDVLLIKESARHWMSAAPDVGPPAVATKCNRARFSDAPSGSALPFLNQ